MLCKAKKEKKRDHSNTQEAYAKAATFKLLKSSLSFNLYLNDLAFSFNNILSDPFVLLAWNQILFYKQMTWLFYHDLR